MPITYSRSLHDGTEQADVREARARQLGAEVRPFAPGAEPKGGPAAKAKRPFEPTAAEVQGAEHAAMRRALFGPPLTEDERDRAEFAATAEAARVARRTGPRRCAA